MTAWKTLLQLCRLNIPSGRKSHALYRSDPPAENAVAQKVIVRHQCEVLGHIRKNLELGL